MRTKRASNNDHSKLRILTDGGLIANVVADVGSRSRLSHG